MLYYLAKLTFILVWKRKFHLMTPPISLECNEYSLGLLWCAGILTCTCWNSIYCLKKIHLIKSMQCREQCFKQCFKPFVLAVGSSNSRSWRVCCCYVILSLFLRHNEFVLQLQLLYLSCKIQTKRKKICPLFSLFVLEMRCQTKLIK